MENRYERIAAEDSAASAKWFIGVEDAISSLERLPRRCPLLRRVKFGAAPCAICYTAREAMCIA
jgi:hypothetical protein